MYTKINSNVVLTRLFSAPAVPSRPGRRSYPASPFDRRREAIAPFAEKLHAPKCIGVDNSRFVSENVLLSTLSPFGLFVFSVLRACTFNGWSDVVTKDSRFLSPVLTSQSNRSSRSIEPRCRWNEAKQNFNKQINGHCTKYFGHWLNTSKVRNAFALGSPFYPTRSVWDECRTRDTNELFTVVYGCDFRRFYRTAGEPGNKVEPVA